MFIGKCAFRGDDYHEAYWVTVQHGVAHVSAQGEFLDCNDAYLKILQRSRSEVVGRMFHEFTSGPDLAVDIRNAEMIVNGAATSYGMDKCYVTREGKSIPVNIQVRRIPWATDYPFEHFVVHCYRRPELDNVVVEERKDGRVVARTRVDWADLLKDNRHAVPWLIGLVLVLGFLAGNLGELVHVIFGQ